MSRSPIEELLKANTVIERHLASPNTRGEIAQDVLSHLRNLVEHLAMALVHGNTFYETGYFKDIKLTLDELPKKKGMRFLWEFHRMLQKSISHYSLSLDDAQRLLLKYREYLVLSKNLALEKLKIEILSGLDMINWNEDPGLQEYYKLIFDKVDSFNFGITEPVEKDRYYVYSRRAVFSEKQLFYEYSLVPAMDFTSKFNHVVAFSKERIPTNYAIAISTKHSSIPALGGILPIMIIDSWKTSIRPCEINKLLRILGSTKTVSGQHNSYKRLMNILTKSKMNLLELCTLPPEEFSHLIDNLSLSGKKTGIQDLLVSVRPFLLTQQPGSNILRYLLYKPRHSIIQKQIRGTTNNLLSNLYLENACIPFDKQPFCTSLIGHSPSYRDLIMCINPKNYEDNLLARAVVEKESNSNRIFIDEEELKSFYDADNLLESYNQTLYDGHQSRKLLHETRHFFLKEAEDDLVYIIRELLSYTNTGIPGYMHSSKAKLASMTPNLDDNMKMEIAASMFSSSRVALLYGSAGTGKTTLVNIICQIFTNTNKIAIANTNPAVDNLHRRIKDSRCTFMTVAKYLNQDKSAACDLLIIDECSTVSNSDMKKVLSRGKFQLLLLVGDTCQIESIRLGNWFDIARSFMKDYCVFMLETSWRSANDDIKELWNSVRTLKDDIAERLVVCGASKPLCKEIFNNTFDDEIILCLNYDGLYGINNINRMLQSANPNMATRWGLQTFKVGDPVLFNESRRFTPILHNNLKGKITSLKLVSNALLKVEIMVDKPLNSFDVNSVQGLEYIDSYPDGKTKIAFSITRNEEEDNGNTPNSNVVPFQIAYAVSIHKAQGLEYDSVKIIVTKDVENEITHSIFYTAITRAKNHLAIFWSPETQKKVIENLIKQERRKDINLIATRNGLKLNKK